MFTCLINILTTIAIAAHAVFGCCAHHAHATHDHDSLLVASTHSHQHTCDHHSDGADTQQGGQDSKDDHQPCDEADCQFVFTLKTDDINRALSFDDQVAGDVSRATFNALVSQLTERQFEQRLLSLAPPKPLHALKQVWLL